MDEIDLVNDTARPRPIFWRVLVQPNVAKPMSKGGIALPDDTRDSQDILNYIGRIIDMGSLAYQHARLQGEVNMPKVGDWVIYGRYAGQVLSYKGTKLLMINDDEVLGIAPDPEALKIYV